MEDDSNHQNTTTTTATTTITTNNNNHDAVNNNDALVLTPRVTVDQLTGWVSAAVVSAFFSSLERFSCVNVTTADLDDDDDDDYEGDGEGSKRSLDSGNSSVGDDPPPRNDVANVSV